MVVYDLSISSISVTPHYYFSKVHKQAYGIVCFVSHPIDKNMKCSKHPDGCGHALSVGNIVVVDATECELVQGCIYYIAVRVVYDGNDDKGAVEPYKGCKIGYLKCLFNQVHLFAHRVAIVTSIELPDETETYTASNVCGGTATIKFIDHGLLNYKEQK